MELKIARLGNGQIDPDARPKLAPRVRALLKQKRSLLAVEKATGLSRGTIKRMVPSYERYMNYGAKIREARAAQEKERAARERVKVAGVSPKKKMKIIEFLKSGATQERAARRFGVSRPTVSHYWTEHTRKHSHPSSATSSSAKPALDAPMSLEKPESGSYTVVVVESKNAAQALLKAAADLLGGS